MSPATVERRVCLAVTDESASSLGEFIRRQRELSDVSMRQFAQLVGISNPYLSQIERGLRAPSDQVVQSIADVLHVSADTLYEQAGVRKDSDGPSKVVEAIREDPDLTGRQRQALIEVYNAFTRSRLRHARSPAIGAARRCALCRSRERVDRRELSGDAGPVCAGVGRPEHLARRGAEIQFQAGLALRARSNARRSTVR